RLAAPHVEADPVDHPASAVGLFKVVRGQIAPGRLLPGRRRLSGRRRLRARPRPGGGGGGPLLAAGERRPPPPRGRGDGLPAAVARFSSGSRRAAGSEQREDVEQTSALEAPGFSAIVRCRRETSPIGMDRTALSTP